MRKVFGVFSIISLLLLIGWAVWDERNSTTILVAAFFGFLIGYLPWAIMGYLHAGEEERDRLINKKGGKAN